MNSVPPGLDWNLKCTCTPNLVSFLAAPFVFSENPQFSFLKNISVAVSQRPPRRFGLDCYSTVLWEDENPHCTPKVFERRNCLHFDSTSILIWFSGRKQLASMEMSLGDKLKISIDSISNGFSNPALIDAWAEVSMKTETSDFGISLLENLIFRISRVLRAGTLPEFPLILLKNHEKWFTKKPEQFGRLDACPFLENGGQALRR